LWRVCRVLAVVTVGAMLPVSTPVTVVAVPPLLSVPLPPL
jgi:hypothetical protein